MADRDKLGILKSFTEDNLEKQLKARRLKVREVLEGLWRSDLVEADDIEFLEIEAIELVKAISELREIHGKINIANNFIQVIEREVHENDGDRLE